MNEPGMAYQTCQETLSKLLREFIHAQVKIALQKGRVMVLERGTCFSSVRKGVSGERRELEIFFFTEVLMCHAGLVRVWEVCWVYE